MDRRAAERHLNLVVDTVVISVCVERIGGVARFLGVGQSVVIVVAVTVKLIRIAIRVLVGRVASDEVLVVVAEAILVVVAGGVCCVEVAEVLQLPPVGDAIAVAVAPQVFGCLLVVIRVG